MTSKCVAMAMSKKAKGTFFWPFDVNILNYSVKGFVFHTFLCNRKKKNISVNFNRIMKPNFFFKKIKKKF